MNIDWNTINGIICWLGGIVTKVIADVISDRIKKHKNKCLKLDLNYSFLFAQYPTEAKRVGTLLTLKIMNEGERKVTVEEWGFLLNNKKALTIIPNTSPVGSNLPVTIEPDSCATVSVYIQNLQKDLSKCINDKTINENTKLKVYARDSFSKYYQQKTEVTYKQILEYIKI